MNLGLPIGHCFVGPLQNRRQVCIVAGPSPSSNQVCRTRWHQDIVKDLELLHAGLQETREQVALLPLAPLRTAGDRRDSDAIDPGGGTVDERESERQSPALTAIFDDNIVPPIAGDYASGGVGLSPFPYAFSTMEAKASQTPGYTSPEEKRAVVRDFIAAGRISVTDAQRLLDLYMSGPNKFVEPLLRGWTTLEALRSRSAILTASVMTVAALHDPQSDRIFPICFQELRRLVGASLFEPSIDRDYIWALLISSHWLSDQSWMLCGVAIRKATEMNLASTYQRVITEGDESAADGLRLWYYLYLEDRSLCYVFGRESLVRDDPSVLGWSEFLKSPVARVQDKPLVMMLGVYPILGPARDLFGLDNSTPVPPTYSTQIAYLNQQLDQWLRVWLNVLQGK